MTKDDDETRQVFRREIERVLSDASRTYPDQVEGLRHLRSMFHAELAVAFAPVFNAALRTAPQDDVDAKRALCSSANEALKSLGLAIRCPRTGQPAIMAADQRDDEDDKGRFRLETRAGRGPVTRALSSRTLVPFELVEDPDRPESLARGFRRRDTSGPTR